MTRILITGGAGFLGHHFCEHLLKHTDWEIVIIDKLNYASKGWLRLRDIDVMDNNRIHALSADFSRPLSPGVKDEIGQVELIFHIGGETHVDNSITDPIPFVEANMLGTAHMLQLAREMKDLKNFYYFSTDEVFGPAYGDYVHKELDPYHATNPYAATKAGAEQLCRAWANTYKLPAIVLHCMNLFGERQHPEKFIPKLIRMIDAGETVTIHSDPTKTISGSRFYIHCRNVSHALLYLVENGPWFDEVFNIVGEREVSNLDMARFVAKVLGKELKYELVDFHSSRPGHDLRYGLDGAKMAALGWKVPVKFEASLQKTIEWTLARPEWLALD